MNIFENIFSITKDDQYKIVKILGIKIRKRYKKNGVGNPEHKEVEKMLSLQSMYSTHSKVFPQFKNINDGKEIAIIASGPSLSDYIPIEGTVNIGLNRAYQYDKVKLDYLFLQDGTATKNYIDEIDKLDDVVKFYGLSLFNENYRSGVRIPEYHLKSKNAYRYYSYNYSDCAINSNILAYPLLSCASVSFPAIHFALWTHPKRIYLVGCDCTAAPYWDGKAREKEYLEISQNVNSAMMNGYKRLKEFVGYYYPDVEIVSVNPVGLKGIFKDIYQKGDL